MALSGTTATLGGAQAFVRMAMRAPLLSAEREQDLARRWRDSGDENALNELITAYLRLVVAMASRFRHYGLPMSDLVQEGSVGLMQAASRFEPEREVRFSTYATWWIRAAMQDFVLRNWSIVRTGTTSAQKTLFFNLRRLRAKLGDVQDHATQGVLTEIAKSLHAPEREVALMAARLSSPDRSLNAPMSEDGGEWQDVLASDSADPEAIVMSERDGAARSRLIDEAMGELNERERLVIRERMLAEETTTLEALGQRLSVSKERVRQIEGAAMTKLRRALLARVPDPVAAGYLG